MLFNVKHYVILQAIAVKLDEEEAPGTRALDELYRCLLEKLEHENPFPDVNSLKATALEMIEEGFLDIKRGFIFLTFEGYVMLSHSALLRLLGQEIPKKTRESLDRKNPFLPKAASG